MTATPARRSCTTCPSFLSPSQQNAVMGTNIGGPVCGTKLIAIGRPNADPKVSELVAQNCSEFGKPHSGYDSTRQNAAVTFDVSFPQSQTGTDQPDRVVTCSMCSNFVPLPAVQGRTGWTAGHCRASGSLLLTDRLGQYARGCAYRSYTMRPRMVFDSVLLPEYHDNFGKIDPLVEARKLRDVDPREFTSPAIRTSPAAAAMGVRAWRKIVDPNGFGPAIPMPVFDYKSFSETERAKIPITGDEERPEAYVDHAGLVYALAAAWAMEDTPALWGEPGTGKTELYRHVAWQLVMPFERISITNTSTLDDLAGKVNYTPEKGTYFTYGRIPLSWTKPCILCLDEPNTGPLEVWQFLRPLTDNSKQLVIDMNDGERMKRHEACYFGMAMNPAWDPRNAGAITLADADGSRLFHVEVLLPPPEVEVAILKDRLMADRWDSAEADKVIQLLMKCATDIRDLSARGTLPISWGVRSQIKVARAAKYFPLPDAFRRGIVDSMEPQTRASILDVVNSYMT